MEITSKKIPHKYRNKYLKNAGSAILGIGNNANFGKEDASDTYTRSLQIETTIIELQTQINELKDQVNELKNTSGGNVEDPTGDGGGGGAEDPTA